MFPLPHIQIHQQYALIGMNSSLGHYEIKQPRPTMEIQHTPAKLDIRQPRGEMQIDQSKAWDALARTPILEVMNRIYGQAHDLAMQGIAKIVEDGNRMAAIHTKANAIADIAKESSSVSFPEFQYAGEASPNNVDIHYIPHKPEINVTEGKVDVHFTPHKPEIEYQRGKLDIYMRQWPKVEITPPQIDQLV